MLDIILFIESLSWSNPLLYLFFAILLILFFSIRAIVQANKILQEEWGASAVYSPFNEPFKGLLKWSTTNQTKVGVLFVVIVLLGIVWALKSGI